MSEPKKKRMKKPVRYVLAEFGCPPQDYTERVKVIESRMCQGLFEEGLHERLLVELPNREREWIRYWKKCPSEQV